MADGSVVIDARVDDDGVNRGLLKIKAKLKGLNTALLRTAALGAAISLGSALIPAAAAATAGIMGLTASLAAAGIGAVAFGAVAVSALGKVFTAADEVAKLEEKIANADSAKERAAAQKELAEYYASMSEQQRFALEELKEFKSFWGGFVKEFENPIFDMFGIGLDSLRGILEALRPTIHAVSGVVLELMESFNQDLRNGAFSKFFEWLETNAAESLRNFVTIGGNVLSGFFSLLMAFSPLGASMEEGLLKMTKGFSDWAASLSDSKGFQTFIDYVKENGPKLLDIIKNVVKVAWDLIQALAPLGSVVLDGLKGVTELLVPVAEKIKEVFNFIRDIIVANSGEISSVWTILKDKAKEIFEGITNAITTALSIIQEFWSTHGEAIKNKVTEVWNSLSEKISSAIAAIVEFVKPQLDKIKAFWDENGQQIMEAVKNAFLFVGDVIKATMDFISGIIEVAWPYIKEIISNTVDMILDVVDIFASLFTGDWQGLWDATKNLVADAWEIIKNIVGGAAGILTDIMSKTWDGIKTITSSIWKNIKDAIRTKIEDIVSGAKEKFGDMTSFIKEQVEKIKGFFSGMKISLPNIKLPHFSLSGKFSLAPPSVPKLNVDWYRENSVFSKPSLIGINNQEKQLSDNIKGNWINILISDKEGALKPV